MDHTLTNIAPRSGGVGIRWPHDVLVLPLTPTAELHSRAGRTIVELQLALSDLVAATAEGVRR